jgi:soluble calcium-activated nucleotidase 1
MGKEWTTNSGELVNNNPQWIKVISPHGEVHSRNWVSNYKRLREAIDIEFPGMHIKIIKHIEKFFTYVY